ncbi:DNA phosphorothioation-dependent restriction protein DptH [Parendozoicomonas sp. Alg238-R29]|uniref:DNA phosphorothioation-dependent restriction protein DptH n=1 Tax=Parendozoicomonas sp. Alg238-R29 TaxID=2993446 RepID=UPI00248F4348|nr:DNA phosphorothioation-dependent restriction protein DptH [Parendozoicomonas sp. Alg238-R29]
MSEARFEQFLVTSLEQWLESRITVGFRYQYQSPDAENTRRLFVELRHRASGTVAFKGAQLPYLQINNTRLICIAHAGSNQDFAEGDNENFISTLRDEVAGQSEAMAGSALLVVHNSLLDTLINSAEDLAAQDAVWSPETIERRLQKHFNSEVKTCQLTLNLLSWQTALIKEEGDSMFGFEPLFNAVATGKEPDLTSLGLLPDTALVLNNSEKQIQKRLEDNRQLKEEIATVVEHFPEEISERLSDFGDKFIEKHITGDEPDWATLDIQNFWDEMDSQKNQALAFHTIESETCKLVGPRNKSESSAGKREKHLILLAGEETFSVPLKVTFFGNDIEKRQFSIKNNKELETLELKGKKTKGKFTLATEIPWSGKPTYLTLRLDRTKSSEKHTFHILVLQDEQFHLAAFENRFLINPANKKKLLVLQTDEHELVVNPALTDTQQLSNNNQVISTSEYGVVNYQELYEQSDIVQFEVECEGSLLKFQIEGEVGQDSLTLPLLMDEGRFNLLFNDSYNGQFIPTKGRVVLDNQENRVFFNRLKLLELEHQLIEQNWLYLSDKANGESIKALNIARFAPDLYEAWQGLSKYFTGKRTQPSLASWGPELVEKTRAYVDAYIEQLDALPLDKNLTVEARQLLQIGYVSAEGKEYISPLHPLVLAYYLQLVDSIRADEANRSFKNLPPVTRKRLNPRGLLPFMFSNEHGFCYTQVIDENPFWLEVVPRQDTSYAFVTKLVREKVEEFIKTFGELFSQVDSAPLIINSINNGENKEVFQGLLSYYQSHLLDSRCIHVNLYDNTLCETEFDRFAEMGSYDLIKQAYRLDKGKARENADTIIDLLRTRLSFSKFKHEEQEGEPKQQTYAHLSFFKNNQKIDCVDIDMTKHTSGLACGGLLNGESSRSEHGSYYTAFGLENIDAEQPHLKLAQLIGRLLKPARKANTVYANNSSIGLAVSDVFRTQLELSYASSIWTTVIDPKVTLDFFQSKDQLLIHYSDQYTSSAGYDAITVTQQKDLYRRMLSQGDDDLIGEYNAFNGEWLLKMITDQEKEQKAKHGVVGAWKVVSTLLGSSDITWVPLSVAEMIRVAGNIGLNMSEGDFARYHKDDKFKGKISDDILFAGFRDGRLYLLPVEVKTGNHGSASLEKAREQALALGRYMEEGLLAPQTLEGKIYRGLFIRQVLMQIEKYQLYHVFEDRYFDEILNNREYWLQGDYTLGHVNDYPKGMVVAHLSGEAAAKTKTAVIDDVLQLEIPEGFLDMLVAKPLGELQPMLTEANNLAIPKEYYMASGLEGSALEQPTETEDDSDTETSEEPTTEEQASEKTEQLVDALPTATVEPEVQMAESEGPLKVLFGSDQFTGSPVYWEPTNTNKLLNPNTAIIGTMGTGKTQFTKSLITQLMRNQHHNVDGLPIGILIFDYKADYVKDDFVQATNAKVFDLYNLPFNPFALFGSKPMLPVHTANLFRSTLATAFNLGNKQQNKVRTLVMEAYDKAGIKPNDSSTWSRPAPTVQQVWDIFMDQEKVEEDSLYAALSDLTSFQIFEPDPSKTESLHDLVSGVTVINLSGYDPQIQNLVVAITLDIFYNQMHQQGSSKIDGAFRQLSKFVLVDEADNFMKQNFPSLRMIMKEGREFGVGTILSTQELSHFKTSENNYASYILSWIVHQVKEIKAQDVRMVFKTTNKAEDDKAIEQIQGLEKHISYHIGGNEKPRKIKDKAFWELIQN